MDDKLILERESEAPENWENEVIFQRGADGIVRSVEVPDDEEASDDAGDDQA